LADNVAITAGSGTTIATDDVSTVHFQKVKLDVGGDGASVPIAQAATGYIPVRLTDGANFVAPSGTSVDDAAFAVGTDDGVPIFGTYKSTRDSVDDNDAGCLAMTAKRGLFVVPETPAGDALVDDTLDALKTVPGGHVAHDAADSGNPLKIGGRAETTFQTAVADGDRVDALFDVYGVQRVRGDHPNLWSYHEDSASALTDTSVQAAPAAGFSVYITDIVFSTGAATACNIFFEEGAAKILGPYYLEAVSGRGLALHFSTPKKCTAQTALTVTTSAAIAHGLDVTGFIAP
jgi:hypothetical protein